MGGILTLSLSDTLRHSNRAERTAMQCAGRPRLDSGRDSPGVAMRLPTRWDLVSTMDDCMAYFERGIHKCHRWIIPDTGNPDDASERTDVPKQVLVVR